jgi:hypothetical protein
MKPERHRCKCLHCKEFFTPDYRNRGRQKYCSAPECRAANKREQQRRWLRQPANRDYFRGESNVKRVQDWRKEHPGYWKRRPRRSVRALQDACPPQPVALEGFATPLPTASPCALQDVCQAQAPLLVGLIAQFTDSALQDDIVRYARRLVAKGQDILGATPRTPMKGNYADQKTCAPPRTVAAHSRTVQLDRPEVGP